MLRSKNSEKSSQVTVVSFNRCPAKTYYRGTSICIGRSVVDHCEIVGNVAKELIARYPKILKSILFPENSAFVAACHDVGKVSPTFYEKLRRACSGGTSDLSSLSVEPDLEKNWGGHAGVSQVAAAAMGAPKWVPEVLGQHHGFSPSVSGRAADAELFGGPLWQQERVALVEELKNRLRMDWPKAISVSEARLLAGLTSVADWIGSGRHFEDPNEVWKDKIEMALDEAGFISPTYRSDLSFKEVFGFEPHAAQQQLIEIANEPGVYVLEAPMGSGKTEAALYLAYRLLARGQATGIYFGLPTQLTSTKIYQRFNEFLKQILAEDCGHRSLLLHGKAWMENTDMGEEGRPGGAWFNHAKRGLLAPFSVGTIDQALMATMNVKHGFVRAFGLAGKVVILDEVHTYDAYTGTVLDALVELLRSLQCTVVILSATLSQERRQQLLKDKVESKNYPLISAKPLTGSILEVPVAGALEKQKVSLRFLQREELAVQEALIRASNGQQVLWIENTVKEVQARYLDFGARAAELGLECGLLHSRFTASDRQQIEDHWVDLFGMAGWPKRKECGRILIGTQVLEQSLDVDADFLVTRVAPTDMLLQRVGRLWRHTGTPRVPSAICEAWILAPELSQAIASPHVAFGPSAYVYSAYVLCRSLEIWCKLSELILPRDIRGLIDQTYVVRTEQGPMAQWLREMEDGTRWRKGRNALRQLAHLSLATDGKTLPESQAQTRYSEVDSFDVLLLRDLHILKEKQSSRLVLLDGNEVILPWRKGRLNRQQWKELTTRLMLQIVPVSAGDAPMATKRDILEKYGFQNCFYLGSRDWVDDESLLRVALVDESDTIKLLNGERMNETQLLEYRDDLGYRALKR